jgi:hypothetical protein
MSCYVCTHSDWDFTTLCFNQTLIPLLELASSEHPAAVESIIAAMGRGKKGHIIQTTGICTLHSNPNSNGNPSDTIYHDGTDFDFTGCFNTKSSEHTITATGMKHGVSTAIVCPAPVFGTGNGPIRRRSTHFSYLIEAILKRGKGFTVKDGKFTMTSTLRDLPHLSLTHSCDSYPYR